MRGFTLIEVELSLFVVAVGALAVVGLYPLGFREGLAAKTDLEALAAAESVMSRAVATLSDTNLSWSAWTDIASRGALPEETQAFADVPADWARRMTVTEGEASRICIGVRVAPKAALLDSAPLFYSEVRFQGRCE